MALFSSPELGFFTYESSPMSLCYSPFVKLYTRKKSDPRSQPNADADNTAPPAALNCWFAAVGSSHCHDSH